MPDCHDTSHGTDIPCETTPVTVAGVTTTRAADGLAYLYAEPGFLDATDLADLITHLRDLHASIGGAE
jgi:hypothetical protein